MEATGLALEVIGGDAGNAERGVHLIARHASVSCHANSASRDASTTSSVVLVFGGLNLLKQFPCPADGAVGGSPSCPLALHGSFEASSR